MSAGTAGTPNDHLGNPCGFLRPPYKTRTIRTSVVIIAPSRTPSVRSPYGITCTDTALLCAMKVIRIIQLPRELHGHTHEIKNRMRSRKIKMGLKIVRSNNRACGCDSGLKPESQPPVRAPTGYLRSKIASFRSFSYGQSKKISRNLSTQGARIRLRRI